MVAEEMEELENHSKGDLKGVNTRLTRMMMTMMMMRRRMMMIITRIMMTMMMMMELHIPGTMGKSSLYWKVNIKILPGQERKWRGCFYCRAKIRLHHV